MRRERIPRILAMIQNFVGATPEDLAVTVESRSGDPWRVLVSTVLSLRARDEVVAVISPKLLKEAPTPLAMSFMRVERIEELIRTGSFYKTKARHLHGIAKDIVERHECRVPDTMEELLKLKGVGRKSANLILNLGFAKLGVCVDVHVHRISNRIGFVKTDKPEETETELMEKLPKAWWIPINGVLIAFGRQHCTPVSPKCSTCPIVRSCERNGIEGT